MTALIGTLFYATGAVCGVASGLFQSAIPDASDYVPRALQEALSLGNSKEASALRFGGCHPAHTSSRLEDSSFDIERYLFQIVVCGPRGIGRTHLLTTWATGEQPAAVQPTIGCDMFRGNIMIGKAIVSVVVWDAGRDMHSESPTRSFLDKADALLLVTASRAAYGTPDVEALEALWTKVMTQQQERRTQQPFAVIRLSRDSNLDDAQTVQGASSEESDQGTDLEDWIVTNGATLFEMTAASDVATLESAMEFLASQCISTYKADALCT